jgi:hypothetical protein
MPLYSPSSSSSGVTTYANLAAFVSAATAGDGAVAIALDTNIMYMSNGVSWEAVGAATYINTLGSLDAAAATATGANLSASGVLSMQSADATQPGLVNNTTQTFSGTKTFSSTITGSISGNAATVTTNANLTGPITSVGNATSIASQTGTGTKFVVDTSPTIATKLTVTGATETANNPVIDSTQTWNNAGVTFTGMKLNVTDTTSATASLLADLQVGAATKFAINKSGAISLGGTDLILRRQAAANFRLGDIDSGAAVAQTLSVQGSTGSNVAGANFTILGSQSTGTGAGGSIVFKTAPSGGSGSSVNGLATVLTMTGAGASTFTGTLQAAGITSTANFDSSAANPTLSFGASADCILYRKAAANWQLGAADVAGSPVAQTLSAQSAAGVSNTAGADFTLNASRGTGTGAGGKLIFKTSAAGGSGSSQNTLTTAITIDSAQQVGIGSTTPASTLHVQGNVQGLVTSVSADTTLGAHYIVAVDDSGASKTMTLPAASSTIIGRIYRIKKQSASNSTIIARAGSDTIDGATSYTLTTQYQAVDIICLSATTWGVF